MLRSVRRVFKFYSGWGSHVIFQTKDSVLWGCGYNCNGQLSLGNTTRSIFTPTRVVLFRPKSKMEIKSVSLGESHSLFLTVGAGAFSSGRNYYSQLSIEIKEGIKKEQDRTMGTAVVLAEKEKIKDVVCGFECSYFITTLGNCFSCGYNSQFQLGHTQSNSSVGVKIPGVSGVVQLVAGQWWFILRTRDNRIYSAGYNAYGQTCQEKEKTGENHQVLEVTFFRERHIQIQWLLPSECSTYFITGKREVYCVGWSGKGEFGNGNDRSENCVPELSPELSGFEQLCVGTPCGHMLVKKGGVILGCGYSSDRFGYADELTGEVVEGVLTPVKIDGLTELVKSVKQLVVGYVASYAILDDGSILSCGDGDFGQLMNKKEDSLDEFTYVGKYQLKRARWDIFSREKKERLEFLSGRYSIYTTTSSLVIV